MKARWSSAVGIETSLVKNILFIICNAVETLFSHEFNVFQKIIILLQIFEYVKFYTSRQKIIFSFPFHTFAQNTFWEIFTNFVVRQIITFPMNFRVTLVLLMPNPYRNWDFTTRHAKFCIRNSMNIKSMSSRVFEETVMKKLIFERFNFSWNLISRSCFVTF